MNSKKSCICICCGDRVAANERRPVVGTCIRLFVAARLFPAYLPSDGYICNKCRSMYKKWKVLPEFCDVLTTIDDCHRMTTTSVDNITDEAETNDEDMDIENDSDQLLDDTSNNEDSMDSGSNSDQTVDVSSSDVQSITDIAGNDEQTEDEDMTLDDGREEVS